MMRFTPLRWSVAAILASAMYATPALASAGESPIAIEAAQHVERVPSFEGLAGSPMGNAFEVAPVQIAAVPEPSALAAFVFVVLVLGRRGLLTLSRPRR